MYIISRRLFMATVAALIGTSSYTFAADVHTWNEGSQSESVESFGGRVWTPPQSYPRYPDNEQPNEIESDDDSAALEEKYKRSGSGTPKPQTDYELPQTPSGLIDPSTGQFYPRMGSGYTDPRTGKFFQAVPGGVIDTQTGKFYPTH